MYFEKLTDDDFKKFFSEGIILNRFGHKLKNIKLKNTIWRNTSVKIIIKDKSMKDKINIFIHDFDIYNDYYSLIYPCKFDISKFYRFMINKFGEKYLDDLLKANRIDPDMVKEFYSLPTDWEDK